MIKVITSFFQFMVILLASEGPFHSYRNFKYPHLFLLCNSPPLKHTFLLLLLQRTMTEKGTTSLSVT